MYFHTDDSNNVTKHTGLNYSHWEPHFLFEPEKTSYGAHMSISNASDLSKVAKGLKSYIGEGKSRKVVAITRDGISVDISHLKLAELQILLKEHAELDIY